MKPLIKYPGGKKKELRIISEYLPPNIHDYYEPFVGGGAVLWELALGENKYINDLSTDLTNFYQCVQRQDAEFFEELNLWNNRFYQTTAFAQEHMTTLIYAYQTRDIEALHLDELTERILLEKYQHIQRKAEKSGTVDQIEENIIAAFRQSVYVVARDRYNRHKEYDGIRAALYVVMRQYAFSGMFRYNSDGLFNIPYGGIPYNNKNLSERIEMMHSVETTEILGHTLIENTDFETFLEARHLRNDDFVFLDPPYDTTFSAYDNNEFNRRDQLRLANYLKDRCNANWMLVIKATDYIRTLYPVGSPCMDNRVIRIVEFDKRYDVCMKGRNDQNCEHLLITNY